MDYESFLRRKTEIQKSCGFDCLPSEVNPILKPHQRDCVAWAVRGGTRALFEAFGLGKTVQQLEIVRIILAKLGGGRGLIVAPLGVRQEFMHDAAMLGLTVRFVRFTAELEQLELIDAGSGIWITNYESIRDGRLNPNLFDVVSLDEASVLRGFGGTKTFREFMALFAGDRKTMNVRTKSAGVQYRFVATATPSPNEYIELLAYAAFLGIMDVSGAKTRFFKRDSTKADTLTIHPHKEREFWDWIASWAIFLQAPSDLGYSDVGYALPPIDVSWHEVQSSFDNISAERNGQNRLFRNVAIGVTDASREKRESMPMRIEKMMQLVCEKPSEQWVIWCDLNDEQKGIEESLDAKGISYSSLYGNQDIDEREALLVEWKEKRTTVFLSKPMMYGAGVNLQQCHNMIFAGIGFKFYDVFQAIHRIHRYLQTLICAVHFIYTEAEREIRKTLERKWAQHEELVAQMTAVIREFGLSADAINRSSGRAMDIERAEVEGKMFRLINNDCIDETRRMESGSVGLILTSIPFSTQYEYSPSYRDFGHTDNNEHFFQQMDFLTPELFRVLQPGRLACIHVKDRIVPGGLTGLGFQVVYPFHAKAIDHYCRHGFAYMGMKTIVTDVVRENNQTYRLGWTEQCKDGTKMGVGMPEYLLIFRKPPSETVNSYADLPVVKDKAKYSRSRWQIDAHGFARSSGNRLLTPEDLKGRTHAQIFRLFRQHSLNNIYDFEEHVKLGEALEEKGMLPVTFMLLQPQSYHPDVWTDITRMRTLNSAQSAKGKEMHLCPMQFDLANRVIEQMSMPGEVVLDPFSGLGTVPLCAVEKGRQGLGIELSQAYFYDSVYYLQAAERKAAIPSLFDLEELDNADPEAISI